MGLIALRNVMLWQQITFIPGTEGTSSCAGRRRGGLVCFQYVFLAL